MQTGYTIELAQPEHVPALPDIEQAAASLFHGWDVPAAVIAATRPLADFQAAQADGLLWVALSPERAPVGFALVEPLGESLHLEEIDVLPQHGRRGVGRALVAAIGDWAQEHGYRTLSLTTFRAIPWNEPFYARLGFQVVNAAQLTPELRERVAEEAARGLDASRRVVMQRLLHDEEER